MNDEKATKVKLYTFAEMKSAVIQAIAQVAQDSAHDSDNFDEPAQVAMLEIAVGSRIVTRLDEMHEKGEL